MKRTYLFVLPCFMVALMATGCGGSSLPPGVTTGVTPLAPLTPTYSTTRTTVTVTETPPSWSTKTAETMAPPSSHCVQDGVDTAGWNTDPDSSGSVYPMYVGPLAPPVSSTGPCYDKLVFDVSTISGVEFNAEYVPVVVADGSGQPVTNIKGSMFIQLVIRAHMPHDDLGNPLYDPAEFNISDAQGYGNLRELRLVTPDYEGYTTFGIGVDTKTPFAVSSHPIGGEKTEIDVYITRPHR